MRPAIIGFLFAAVFMVCTIHAEDKTVTSKELGFQITYLDSWNIDKKPEIVRPAFGVSPRSDGVTQYAVLMVNTWDVKVGAEPKTVIDAQMKEFLEKMPNIEMLEKSELKLNGTNALKVTYLCDSTKKKRLKCTTYFLLSGSLGYRIHSFALKDEYDKVVKDMDQIVNSFKLLEIKSVTKAEEF